MEKYYAHFTITTVSDNINKNCGIKKMYSIGINNNPKYYIT